MLNELIEVNNRLVDIMKRTSGVLGGWYFGSVMHGMSDDFSDIDIVFLIDDSIFAGLDKKLPDIISEACDQVVIAWAEDYSNEKIANYDFILMHKGKVFQYDVFLINKRYADDFMCQIHYSALKKEDIIFDVDENVGKLMGNSPQTSCWNDDIDRIIRTYWLHIQMSAKYFIRRDFFKLNDVMRILQDSHTSLILCGADKILWGGSANKLHFVDCQKQKHLMKYGCIEDFALMRENLLKSMLWFEEDVNDFAAENSKKVSCDIGRIIKDYWIKCTNDLFKTDSV